jgi:hypothetical protein
MTGKRAAKHDWVAIKGAYVEGILVDGVREPNPTLEQIAERFGVHVSALKRECAKERWLDERNLFNERLARAQREHSTKILASKGAEFDALSMRVAEKLFLKMERRLDKALVEDKPLELDPGEMSALATAAKSAQHVGRIVMGDSTDNARLYAELLQKPDLSQLTDAEVAQLEQLLSKARPGGVAPA